MNAHAHKSRNCEGKAKVGVPSTAKVLLPTSRKPKASKGRSASAVKAKDALPEDAPISLADEGLYSVAGKARADVLPAGEPEMSAKGPRLVAEKATRPMPKADTPKANGRGRDGTATNGHQKDVPSVADLCAAIRSQHSLRIYWMKQRMRIMGALGARIRFSLGWSMQLPQPERKKIEKQTADLIRSDGIRTEWETIIVQTKKAVLPIEDYEDDHAKVCTDLAEQLPVWRAFGESVRGFGAASLAVIVGEAGDLSTYPKKGHLWKRMGVAVIDGIRQGGLKKGADAEDWIEHGYNRQRRSRMFMIGDTLLKSQIRKVKDDNGEDTGKRMATGKYGAAYLARKEYEVARNPEIKPIVAHRRAQRYMEKMLLRDLLAAWKGERAVTSLPEKAIATAPDPQPNEGKARHRLPQGPKANAEPSPNEREANFTVPQGHMSIANRSTQYSRIG